MSTVDLYRRFVASAARYRFTRFWLGPKVIAPLDRLLFRRGGLLSLGSRAYPTLLLTTVGRKTGRRHQVVLFHLELAGAFLVVASNFGREKHPGWSANLLANPSAHVLVDGGSHPVRARLLAPEEKKAVWAKLLDIFEPFQLYEDETERSLRVFALTPDTRRNCQSGLG